MARLTESALRRIVREETARIAAHAGRPARRRVNEAFDDDDFGDDERGEGPRGWYGGGGFGDELMLDSGDPEIDELWEEWVSCTDRLLGATVEVGKDLFPQEDDPDSEISVVRGMVDYIKNR